ncbi:hypothetical protein CLV78_106109 [Aliiruegeria haliotis]|uniref:Uncharacterized protein n=1 Tax=Aliiruegeria haliotis TaxID=1280846 RepID=A0A2T0RN03_9RHOB|nr:hypothetical protein CLV78_106109 [Aliiruegeria haliotis]
MTAKTNFLWGGPLIGRAPCRACQAGQGPWMAASAHEGLERIGTLPGPCARRPASGLVKA